jgi:hypothetical protein
MLINEFSSSVLPDAASSLVPEAIYRGKMYYFLKKKTTLYIVIKTTFDTQEKRSKNYQGRNKYFQVGHPLNS